MLRAGISNSSPVLAGVSYLLGFVTSVFLNRFDAELTASLDDGQANLFDRIVFRNQGSYTLEVEDCDSADGV